MSLPVKDLSDWIEAGGTAEQLHALVEATPQWTPVEASAPDATESSPHKRYTFTDTGRAERFADTYRGQVHYVPEWDKWIAWDGTHYEVDVAGIRVLDLTREAARAAIAEAAECRDDDIRRALVKGAMSGENANARRAVLSLARAEHGIAISLKELDRDRYLLTCRNGTLDLRSGTLRPHNPKDLITRMLPWAYEASAICGRWEQFLSETLRDADTINCVQRAIGYSLTGDVSEHVLFFLHGAGANGKTVFLNILLALVGDYGTQAPTSMLLAKQGEAHPTELTVLSGRRVAVCQETPAGQRWAEELLKHITGGDRISARRMREDFWQFEPTHKLWIAGNHKPVVRGQDEGIWRRLRLIPFERVVPEAERDPKLAEKLCAELPGILRWAVDGCKLWQRDGLRPSEKIQAATSEYRAESDRLGPFIGEECNISDPATVTPRAALYRRYVDWSEAQGERRPLAEREVAELLRGRGIGECWTRANGKRCRGWQGIELAGNTGNSNPPDFPVNRHIDSLHGINGKNGGNVLHLLPGDSEPAASETPNTDEEGAF